MKCKVCGREIEGGKCSYDGYINTVSLSGNDDAAEKARAKKYRDILISKITNISIMGRKGEYNSSGEFKLTTSTYNKIADGSQCFGKIVWMDQVFAQHPDPNSTKEYLEISYKYNGKEYKVKAGIKLLQTDDFWKLGVKLNEDFTLEFYLGNPQKYNISDKIRINLL